MKNKWLLIPILTMTLPLTGCDTKDYKFDDPKAIIRNLSSKRGAVLNYPYESKASLSGADYIYDIENNVVNGLKKATFEKGKPNTPNPDKYIEFTLHSYTSKTALGNAEFTLYANGYITYDMTYIYDQEKVIVKHQKYNFTFDASEAEAIIDAVYEEFDKAKAEEERFLSTITVDHFFEITANKQHTIAYGVNVYYDDGRMSSELQKLDYTPVDFETGRQAMTGQNIKFTHYDKKNNRIAYEGGEVVLELLLDSQTNYAYLHLYGEDCYHKYYSYRQFYSLNPDQVTSFIENTKEITKDLKKFE